MKYTVAVDFDGVLHSYKSPWINAHTIPDEPVPGAIEFLHDVAQKFSVVIHTTRGKTILGRMAVKSWIKKHAGNLWNEGPGYVGLEDIKVTYKKVPALVYIDDRAWRFNGTFPTVDEIHRAKPWNKP